MRVYRLVPQLASSNLTTPFYNSKSMTTIAPKSLHYLRYVLTTVIVIMIALIIVTSNKSIQWLLFVLYHTVCYEYN